MEERDVDELASSVETLIEKILKLVLQKKDNIPEEKVDDKKESPD